MMPEQQQRILGYFIEEAKDHLNTIEQGLLNLQATIQDSEMVNEVFRAAHSVKGGAAMLSLGSIQLTSHRLEDYFKVLKEAPTTQVDRDLESMFLQVFDGLQALLEELQGPFGLTEDKAQEVMADIEPVFERLEKHLNTLVAHAPVVAASPKVAVAAEVRSVPPQPTARSEDSALKLVFSSDVPGHLREMLTLFKQADSEASRAALQACCEALKRTGEQFDLPQWCELAISTSQAVGNREQTYRALAPVVIKELKRAQEQVLAGQAMAIAITPELAALMPIVMETEDELGDIDSLLDDALATTEEPDLADLFETEVQPATAAAADDLDWLEIASPETDESTDPEDLTDSLLGIASDHGFPNQPQSQPPHVAAPREPAVGAAELNSLADLFEGEVAGLESPWEEMSEGEAIAEKASPDIDLPDDFSDLLDESLDSEEAADTEHDLVDLFGDTTVFEADLANAAGSALFDESADETSDEDFDDLFDLGETANSVDSREEVDAAGEEDGLDALLDSVAEADTSSSFELSFDLENTSLEPGDEALDLSDTSLDGADEALDFDLDNAAESGPGAEAFGEDLDLDEVLGTEAEDGASGDFDAMFAAADTDLTMEADELADSPETAEGEPSTEAASAAAMTESEAAAFEAISDPWSSGELDAGDDGESALDALDELWGKSSDQGETQEQAETAAGDLDFGDFPNFDAESTAEAAAPLELEDAFNADESVADNDFDALFEGEEEESTEEDTDLADLLGETTASESAPVEALADELNELDSLDLDNSTADVDDFLNATSEAQTAQELGAADLDDLLSGEAEEASVVDFSDELFAADSDETAASAELGDLLGLDSDEPVAAAGDALDFDLAIDQGADADAGMFDADLLFAQDEVTAEEAIADATDSDFDALLAATDAFGEDAADVAASEGWDDILNQSEESATEADFDLAFGDEDLDSPPLSVEDAALNGIADSAIASEFEFESETDSTDSVADDLFDDGAMAEPQAAIEAEDDDDFFGTEATATADSGSDTPEFDLESELFSADETEDEPIATTATSPEAAIDDFFDTPAPATGSAATAMPSDEDNEWELEEVTTEDAQPEDSEVAAESEQAESDNLFDDVDLGSDDIDLDSITLDSADLAADLSSAEADLEGVTDRLATGLVAAGTGEVEDDQAIDDSLFDESLESADGEALGDDLFDESAAEDSLEFDFGDLDSESEGEPIAFSAEASTPASIEDAIDFADADSSFGDLDDLLADSPADGAIAASASGITDEETDSGADFDELDSLLSDDERPEDELPESVTDAGDVDFGELDALLGDDVGTAAASENEGLAAVDDEFSDLEKLLEEADQTLGGGSPSIRSNAVSRAPRRVGGIVDQTMRVSVKHLDNLNNLVGELVVNRNSLEQDQDRLRQFLDNLLFQVQQLNDVGQRMRDLYERSLLESSLLASRQAFQSGGLTRSTDSHHGSNGGGHATGAIFDALEMDRFTGFHTLTQEMVELIVRVRESASDIAYTVESTDQIARQFRQVTTQLQEGLNKARMVPFAQTADRLPRAVRDISIKCGKEAQLVVEGRDTLIDKMILERLYDPMTHLVNNAITHGIESPDERAAVGKSREGAITVRAFYQGNQTVIYIADDGGGINPDIVKRKAIQKGIITQAEADSMNTLETYELLFRHGFSTRDKADDFAGRGVGMDVVRTALSEIRGSITIDSELGKGTSFTIRLPLTLSISKALSCLNNQARIAFPMDGVEDMFDVPRERIQRDENGHTFIQWRDTMLTFQPLSELLQFNRALGRGRVYGGSQDEDMVSIVVLRNANTYIGIQVDRVLGEQEIVIKQIEGPVPKPMGIAGATVLGDGRVMPIGDVLELIDIAQGRVRREAGSSLWSQVDLPPEEDVVEAKAEPTVLIVDDSITVRELLSMSFNKIGYRVEQARDGQEAWEKMRSGLPCDLVFCDIEMPRMDGLELLSRMQKDSLLKQIPIAMLTSRGADRHRQMAIDLGASGYFTKPYLEEALLDAAQRMLNGEVLLNKISEEAET